MQRMKREMQNELKFIPDRLSDPLLDLGEFVLADIVFDVRIKYEHAFDAEFQVIRMRRALLTLNASHYSGCHSRDFAFIELASLKIQFLDILLGAWSASAHRN